jgi:hypothetical protein
MLITETDRTHLVLFGMQNRTIDPCLAAISQLCMQIAAARVSNTAGLLCVGSHHSASL